MKKKLTLLTALLLTGIFTQAQFDLSFPYTPGNDNGDGTKNMIGQRHYLWDVNTANWTNGDSFNIRYNNQNQMVRLNHHSIDGPWELVRTINQDYNANKNLSVRIDTIYSSSISGVKYTFTYNSNNKEILAHQYMFSLPMVTSWTNQLRRTTTYTASDSVNSILTEFHDYNKKVWNNHIRILKSYNSKNLDTGYTYQSWDNENKLWTEVSNSIYWYDSKGRVIKKIFQEYSKKDLSYLNKELYEYNYDVNDRLVAIRFSGFNVNSNLWIKQKQYTYSYNAQAQIKQAAIENWVSNNWVPNNLSTNTYDSKNFLQQSLGQIWENNKWSNKIRTSYTRDASGYHTRILWEYWNVNTLTFQNKQAINFWFEPKKNSGIPKQPDVRLNVFPNPSNNSLVFVYADKNIAYEIYDLQGKVVQQGKLQPGTNSIILNEAKGNYILKAGNSSAILVIE